MPATIPKSDFKRRRAALMNLMDEGSIAVIPSASLKTRNRDSDFLFRQDSDFHYLTGFNEPDAALVLEIEDHARPFDPLTAPAMATGTDLAHATIGGRGIRLIKTYSDEQCYSYVSGANRLKLVVSKTS